jgi:hypothetical protein
MAYETLNKSKYEELFKTLLPKHSSNEIVYKLIKFGEIIIEKGNPDPTSTIQNIQNYSLNVIIARRIPVSKSDIVPNRLISFKNTDTETLETVLLLN